MCIKQAKFGTTQAKKWTNITYNVVVFFHSNDLALLKLDKSPVMNDSVGVACLPEAEEILAHGTPCYISGWGNLYSNATKSSSVILSLNCRSLQYFIHNED